MQVRTTIMLDEFLAARVRQQFGGNLSKGVNALLHEHLQEKKNEESMFGALKGRVSVEDVKALEREEEELENAKLCG